MDGVAARPGRESARVKVAIAVVAALCAAFCFALGSLAGITALAVISGFTALPY
jgi:hypothetical protein